MVSSSYKLLMLSSLSEMSLYSYLILLHPGIGDISEMRSALPREVTESPIPKSEKDNKRKRVSKPEDPQDKKSPTQRRRRNIIPVDIDSVHQLNEEEEDQGEDSALVVQARKPVKVAQPSEPETLLHDEEASMKDAIKTPESLEVEIVPWSSTSTPEGAGSEIPRAEQRAPSDLLEAMTIGHSPSLPAYSEEAIREAQALQMPDLGGVPIEEDPFRDCFTRAFTKFRADLSQCETKLWKASDEKNALNLLCSQKEEELKDLRVDLAKARKDKDVLDKKVTVTLEEYGLLDPTVEANTSMSQLQQKLERIELLRGEVDQIKADYDRWKENMDPLAAEKEAALAKLASAEAQLQGAKEKSLAQAKRIDELEVKLAEAKAEVGETKSMTDKTIVVYLADAEAAQTQLREASDQEQRSNDLAKCQSRRKTLKEIHARGYNLSEEIT
ncbi:uncharacterized protein [Nicotiana sylvestris]|uniref:uncharacterized protein n=1 Tax=Nicotiana sylvestris TaxID=4096 RepID=UPI00388C558B